LRRAVEWQIIEPPAAVMCRPARPPGGGAFIACSGQAPCCGVKQFRPARLAAAPFSKAPPRLGLAGRPERCRARPLCCMMSGMVCSATLLRLSVKNLAGQWQSMKMLARP